MQQILHKHINYGWPKYAVTPSGKILNLERNKPMKLNHNHRGYWQVKLCQGGRYKSFLVHRLVAEAYIPKEPGMTFVNHKDGDKKNNRSSNLEWCTNQANKDHAMRSGNFKSKLSIEDVLSIRQIGKSKPYSKTAEQYGITRMMVYRIVNNKSWQHLP